MDSESAKRFVLLPRYAILCGALFMSSRSKPRVIIRLDSTVSGKYLSDSKLIPDLLTTSPLEDTSVSVKAGSTLSAVIE